MKGYWRNESATKDSINDQSRFNSGDLINLINQHLEKYLLNNDIDIKGPIEYDTKGVKIFKLPHVLNAQKSKEISKEIDELLMGEENINLDFSNV